MFSCQSPDWGSPHPGTCFPSVCLCVAHRSSLNSPVKNIFFKNAFIYSNHRPCIAVKSKLFSYVNTNQHYLFITAGKTWDVMIYIKELLLLVLAWNVLDNQTSFRTHFKNRIMSIVDYASFLSRQVINRGLMSNHMTHVWSNSKKIYFRSRNRGICNVYIKIIAKQ